MKSLTAPSIVLQKHIIIRRAKQLAAIAALVLPGLLSSAGAQRADFAKTQTHFTTVIG